MLIIEPERPMKPGRVSEPADEADGGVVGDIWPPFEECCVCCCWLAAAAAAAINMNCGSKPCSDAALSPFVAPSPFNGPLL